MTMKERKKERKKKKKKSVCTEDGGGGGDIQAQRAGATISAGKKNKVRERERSLFAMSSLSSSFSSAPNSIANCVLYK